MSASGGPIGAELRVREVDAAVGQADVVDDARELVGRDRLPRIACFDLIANSRRSPRSACRPARARAAGTARRPPPGRSPGPATARSSERRRRTNAEEHAGERSPRRRAHALERAAVRRRAAARRRRSKPRAGSRRERIARHVRRCVLGRDARFSRVLRHRRHQRARQQVRREHREDDRLRQRHEQIPRDAGEEEHRHEHDADAQRRDERRHGDLLRRRRGSPARAACPARGCGGCSRSSTVASSTRMPTASARPPSVMMLIVSPSALERDDRARIDSGIEIGDDQRAAPAAEEEQDHQRGQRTRRSPPSRSTPLIAARTNSDWSASGLIFSSGGSVARSRGSARLIALDDVERRGAAGLQDRQQRRALAVARARCWSAADSRRARARRRGCRSSRRSTVLIGRSLSSSSVVGLLFSSTLYSRVADLRRAGGQDQVLRADRVDDVGRREALGLQRRADRGRPGSARCLPP